MKIQLLIATADKDYTDYLSQILSEKYDKSFEVTVCSLPERLNELTSSQVFDVALVDYACERVVEDHNHCEFFALFLIPLKILHGQFLFHCFTPLSVKTRLFQKLFDIESFNRLVAVFIARVYAVGALLIEFVECFNDQRSNVGVIFAEFGVDVFAQAQRIMR